MLPLPASWPLCVPDLIVFVSSQYAQELHVCFSKRLGVCAHKQVANLLSNGALDIVPNVLL